MALVLMLVANWPVPANAQANRHSDASIIVQTRNAGVRVRDLRRFFWEAYGADSTIESVERNAAGMIASVIALNDDAIVRTVSLNLFRSGAWEKGSCELYISQSRNQIRSLSCSYRDPILPAFEASLDRFSSSAE